MREGTSCSPPFLLPLFHHSSSFVSMMLPNPGPDPDHAFFFFSFLTFIYLFWLHQVLVVAHGIFVAACRLLVVACELLVAACMWDLVPRPGIEPRPSALGTWSLTHWTTREVPMPSFSSLHLYLS